MKKNLFIGSFLTLVSLCSTLKAQYTWEYEKINGQPQTVITHVYNYDEKEYKVDFEKEISSYQYTFNESGWIREKKDLKSNWRYTYNYNQAGGVIETIEYEKEEGKMVERINYRYGSSGRVEEERHYNSNEKMRRALVIDTKKFYQSDLYSTREDTLIYSSKKSFDRYGNLIEHYIRDQRKLSTYEVTKYNYYYDKEKKITRIEILVYDNSKNLKGKELIKFVEFDANGNWIKAEKYLVDNNVIMLNAVETREIKMY